MFHYRLLEQSLAASTSQRTHAIPCPKGTERVKPVKERESSFIGVSSGSGTWRCVKVQRGQIPAVVLEECVGVSTEQAVKTPTPRQKFGPTIEVLNRFHNLGPRYE